MISIYFDAESELSVTHWFPQFHVLDVAFSDKMIGHNPQLILSFQSLLSSCLTVTECASSLTALLSSLSIKYIHNTWVRSGQLDRTFWRLTIEIPALDLQGSSESLLWVRMESVSLFEYQSVSYSKQMPAAPDVHLSEPQIRYGTASGVRNGCAGAVFCCLKLMYHCLCLQTSAGCCQEEQPDGSFPVGRVWQLGLQDLTGHSAGESGRRSHYHPAQACHGGGYVHVKTRNWLKHSLFKNLRLVRFFKDFFAHQGCIYLLKNTGKTGKIWNIAN